MAKNVLILLSICAVFLGSCQEIAPLQDADVGAVFGQELVEAATILSNPSALILEPKIDNQFSEPIFIKRLGLAFEPAKWFGLGDSSTRVLRLTVELGGFRNVNWGLIEEAQVVLLRYDSNGRAVRRDNNGGLDSLVMRFDQESRQASCFLNYPEGHYRVFTLWRAKKKNVFAVQFDCLKLEPGKFYQLLRAQPVLDYVNNIAVREVEHEINYETSDYFQCVYGPDESCGNIQAKYLILGEEYGYLSELQIFDSPSKALEFAQNLKKNP